MRCGIVRRRLEKVARSRPEGREVVAEDALEVAAAAEEREVVADAAAAVLKPKICSGREV
jgi:hypothetical protein